MRHIPLHIPLPPVKTGFPFSAGGCECASGSTSGSWQLDEAGLETGGTGACPGTAGPDSK
jgi:hypothetical protein